MNRYDAATTDVAPASISFREIVACDKGEHWPMNTSRESRTWGEERGIRGG